MSSRLLLCLCLPVGLISTTTLVIGCVDETTETVPGIQSSGDAAEVSSEEGTERASQASTGNEGADATTAAAKGGSGNPLIVQEPQVNPPRGMAWVPGGSFRMGSTDGFPDELPIHEVELDGFWMDETEVTAAEFKRFVDATGYVTIAEKKPKREDFIGQLTPAEIKAIPEENLVKGSICFNPDFDRSQFPQDRRPAPHEIYLVWKYEHGANWQHPDGPDSDIKDRMNHPVTHVAWDDAVAYCKWAGKELPSEAEWEYASRAGLDQKMYSWGDQREVNGRWMTNIWQGKWPYKNLNQDGFAATSPVRSYEPNAFGLYDMSGNVWEWCQDYYRADYYENSPKRNPPGPKDSLDPLEPRIPKRIQRGGSFMCNANYCTGYRNAARMKGDMMSGSWHCGFRCVVRANSYEEFSRAKGALIGKTHKATAPAAK